MNRYLACGVIFAVIWFINGRWLAQAVRERIISEIYMHVGLGVFFMLLTLELLLGNTGSWPRCGIAWLKTVGSILYIPAGALVISSFVELHRKGKSDTGDITATTSLIDTGIYSIIRQPMTLGLAIWSFALIILFQSIVALGFGLFAFICFWFAASKEAEYNMQKFGEKYQEYMRRVPMWNVFTGLRG